MVKNNFSVTATPRRRRERYATDNCWRVWLTRPRNALGYCWHGKVAWRTRPSGEFITASEVDRAKHLAMVRALDRRTGEPQIGSALRHGIKPVAIHVPRVHDCP
jgi:hypothetical protein